VPTLRQLVQYFLYLGSCGFGGPVADVPTTLIALGVLGLVWRFRIPEPILIAGCAAAGLLIVSLGR
jgi:hypothetical protein